jgi:signal transduction histidine kinase
LTDAVLERQEGLAESLYWLIRLRWFAVGGVVLTVLFADLALRIGLAYGPLYSIAAALGAYNFLFLLYLNRARASGRPDLTLITNRLANAQIPLDLLCLAALLHFSGGPENPFAYYFVFHMIIASILLSRRASYLQAVFASVLFLSVSFLEYRGLWDHHCLNMPGLCFLGGGPLPLLGSAAAFVSTLFIAVYMASSITSKLRQKEATLLGANLLLKEKDKIKSNYVLRVSHDVKEHLAAIQACLDPVLHGLTGELNPGQEGLLKRSYARTEKLLVFVKALLEITRIKLSNKMETGPFSLLKTAESAVHMVEEKAGGKKIALTWSIAPGVDIINGAQIYIEETIANFLANSIKYTPEGGSVELAITDEGDNVKIRVTDTGIGVPKEDLPHLFEEFFRAKNARATERTGTGLGLSIAREVAEKHNGGIWAESQEGKGASFFLVLPKSAA